MSTDIALLGDYNSTAATHVATDAAIQHSMAQIGQTVSSRWVSTHEIDDSWPEKFRALWVVPGSPYRNMDNTLNAIRRAREQKIPCFGTCGGFQHMIIEYARNVLGHRGAQHAEYDASAPEQFVSLLTCSLSGREMNLSFDEGSRVAELYGNRSAVEQYYCNFGVNPDFVPTLKKGPLRFSGHDAEGEIRTLELPGHPFFIGTLFVPQTRSTLAAPHPLVTGLLRAVLRT